MTYSLHHIAISVSDLERSVKFYSYFNFKLVGQWQTEKYNIAHLKSGDVYLEIFAYKNFNPSPLFEKSLDDNLSTLGIKHFGLKVKSVKDTYFQLQSNGFNPSTELSHGKTGIDYFFATDPDGMWLEIVQDDRNL